MRACMKKHTILFFFLLIYTITTPARNALTEKKIVVVIPSYNNPIEIIRECLLSALMQDYSNYEIVFSDDCSPQPGSEQMHKQLIAELDIHHKITYRRNNQRCGPIGNQWHIFHSINPDNSEDNSSIIVVNLDGDDIFLRSDALSIINILHEMAWVTWGSFSILPSRIADPFCRAVPWDIITKNQWRSSPFCMSHVRTYRLSLLKALPLSSFLYYDRFYPAAGDLSLMLSACEQAGIHTAFNPIPVYGYRQTPQNESNLYRKEGADCIAYARAQKPLQPLQELPRQLTTDHYKASLIIFSDDRPEKLAALLESIKKYISGLDNIVVLYSANEQSEQSYQILKSDFEEIEFVRRQSTDCTSNFKKLLLHTIDTLHSDYLMFATDTTLIKDSIEINKCIKALQKTHAFGFYFGINPHNAPIVPIHIDLGDSILAWHYGRHFNQKSDEPFNTMSMVLFPKKELHKVLHTMKYKNQKDLAARLRVYSNGMLQKIGLCFSQSKVSTIDK